MITLRKRFDETTIGAQRGNGPLAPGPRRVVLQDENGRRYRLLTSVGMTKTLRPGESNEAVLTFEAPATARKLSLRIEDADPVKRLFIGSETAPLHKRTVFAVG